MATAAAAMVAVAMGSAPAALASDGPTSTSFTLTTTGLLSISTPGTADLGSADINTSTTLSDPLGDVTVTDNTSPDNGSWTATVEMSVPFTTGAGTTNETIPDSDVNYDATAGCTSTTGTGTFTGFAGDLTNPITAFTGTGLFGDNACTWDPTITVTFPTGVAAGTYNGTILHSVTNAT